MIIPYTTGAHADLLARVVAQKLSELWSQPVVVDNRPGGGGSIGTLAGAKAAPDGYNLLLTSTGVLIVNPAVQPNPQYDPVKDFDPVVPLVSTPWVLYVNPTVRAKDIAELVALAKSQQGKLNAATPGIGTTNHLAVELLMLSTGIRVESVHYKGSAQAITDLLSGRNHFMFDSLLQMQHVKEGRLRALAVTSKQRSRFVPEVPTVAEAGFPNLEVSTWFGFFFPANTPREYAGKVNADVEKVMGTPEVQARLSVAGFERMRATPAEFRDLVGAEAEKWRRVVREANVRAQ